MHRYELDENCPSTPDSFARERTGRRLLAILAVMLVTIALSAWLGIANAQTTGRTLTLTWLAPTSCAGGSPIANCPVLGYSIQKNINGTWTQIGTTAASVRTFMHENQALGTHTYRVLATSDAGPSAPSNEASRTVDVPGAPGGIVITVTVTVTP